MSAPRVRVPNGGFMTTVSAVMPCRSGSATTSHCSRSTCSQSLAFATLKSWS